MKRIPPFRLVPQPLDHTAEALPKFEWAPPEIGSRHQLGGEPAFLQSEERPICPDCKQPMTFFAQLDSINDEFNIADCGMIYVFVCFDCNTTHSMIQSY